MNLQSGKLSYTNVGNATGMNDIPVKSYTDTDLDLIRDCLIHAGSPFFQCKPMPKLIAQMATQLGFSIDVKTGVLLHRIEE